MSDSDIEGVDISKPDKELFPASSGSSTPITKFDLARYYADVAEMMVPQLEGRPVNMQRFPDGIDAASFYEKKVPSYFPDWVHTVQVDTADGSQRQVVANNARTLVFLAQQACLTPHTWLSSEPHLDQPDQLIVDLDPSDVSGEAPEETLKKVRRATRLVGELFDDLGLTSYLKTTGSRGYHVLVPLRAAGSFDEVRDFAHSCAERLAQTQPDLLTVEQRKPKRGDRVFVDVLRNGYGQTAVPPYAVRARPGATVATPIGWDELSRIRPDEHTIESVRRRLARKDDPWGDINEHAQALTRARKRL